MRLLVSSIDKNMPCPNDVEKIEGCTYKDRLTTCLGIKGKGRGTYMKIGARLCRYHDENVGDRDQSK